MLSSNTLLQLVTFITFPLTIIAQSTSSCNPLTEDSCSADKALASSFYESFSEESDWFSATAFEDRIKYSDEGLKLTLAERYDNPGLKSNFYIMFGKLEVVLKAAPGQGIVSSFYLQSDDLDEIDLEWIGSDTTEVQTNYFSKGNTTTYDRGQFHGVYQPQEQYHNYTIDWTKDELVWYLDGSPLRTLSSDSPSGYPQSPMYVVMGIWAGGDPDNAAGTIEWAGGLTDYTQAPFSMFVKNVIVTDYSTGSEYKYTDKTGAWTSIEAVDGEVNGRIEQAKEDFQTLLTGGSVASDSSSSSSSKKTSSESSSTTSESSSSDSSTSSSSSPSTDSSSSSSTDSSSSSSSDSGSDSSTIHDGLASSKSRAGTVYTSSASSLVTRSSSSQSRTAVISNSGTQSGSQSTITSTLSGDVKNSTTLATSSSSSDSSSSSETPATLTELNGSFPTFVISDSGFKALFVSICISLGMIFV